jgi:hypothetical protein
MNERIKELMGKTLDDKFSHTWDTMTHEGLLQFSEKFAQLIVQKCADIGQQYADGNYEVPNQILEYFGMQEPEE